MIWLLGSIVILGGLVALIVASTWRRPDDPGLPPSAAPRDHTIGQRVRRLEDELDDLHAHVRSLREDVHDLQRQLEDRN